ncbi:GDSL-type esterase/lipase family protein [Nocardiopsis sp. YSL2]|uniref:GDSL-type esterase/lipase family protein n=1 Tax=Nocardiopsis sp. YSL2 TaxID=2939492 RepID=UPI0026F41B76|nr:GDSL-type esterase/lipase family protein [Nocardiopsis sp. YSL2]
MLAAMAVTLLLIRTDSGLGGGADERSDEPVSVPGPPEGELRIMPVGDSLTQGSSGDFTWRYRLWTHLEQSGVDAVFVGPHDDMHGLDGDGGDRTYADPDFDTGHAARWGATSEELSADLAEIAAEHDPHYLLLLTGMEDMLRGGGADHALEGVGEMVSTVRVVRGEARFVVGELPPVEGTGDDARLNEEIAHFNMGVVDLAEQLTSSESPVIVAQVARDYAPSYDNWDEVHPNARGEVKIAAAFADALAEPLGVGEPYPRPLPNVSVGPLEAPEPEAEEAADGLLLSWPSVPGATGYRVVQRRIAPDPDEATVLPAVAEGDGDRRSVLVEALFSGARYEFVVRPVKGRDEGEESEPVQVLWDDDPPPGPTGVRVHDGGAVVEWDAVEEATHYEVWLRALECGPADEFRRPRDGLDGSRPGDAAPDGDGSRTPDRETPTPRPEPRPEPPPDPAPEPVPDPAPAQPDPPTAPTPAPSPGIDCERRDGRGPQDGEGWRTQGSTGEDTRWEATVSGHYEVVVRSYRDYVEGRFSDSVLL